MAEAIVQEPPFGGFFYDSIVLEKRLLFLFMTRLDKCVHFYIGCNTNKGKLVGVKKESLLIQAEAEESIIEYFTQVLGSSLFLYLQHLNDVTEAQSKELIKKGIAIGRLNGYTFSNEGFFI
jgi:hypothetical protein